MNALMQALGTLAPSPVQIDIVVHLVASVLAGGLIGIERSYHGRPAGFRTHTLVCLASSLLMLLTLYESTWNAAARPETVRLDPTRMAQGIMTGIGFLGAGVIFKEGLTVRGLTTAASIWITAAIGVLVGVGFYFPAVVATALTLGTLALFRMIERRMPSSQFAYHALRFEAGHAMDEARLRELMSEQGFTIANLSWRLEGGREMEYRMMLRTVDAANFGRLAHRLQALPGVAEFRVSPTGD